MLLLLILGLDLEPQTEAQLALELNTLQAAHRPPKRRGDLESYDWTTGSGHQLLCTRVNNLAEICTWPVGSSYGFGADALGPYGTWDLAGHEQIRRLKLLDLD